MAENWDLSAVVNTPATNTFSENVHSENPLEFLNHLTFGDDDGLLSFSELEPPICTGVQDSEESFFDPFLVPTSTDDHDAPQGGGNNILNPTPISSHDFQVLPPQNHSPFILQDYQQQQQQQNHHRVHPNFSSFTSPNSFISNSFQQQFGQAERPFLQPPPLLQQRQVASPIPIPRLSTKPAARPRSRRKSKCNQRRKVEQVPADKLNSDIWSWRKYGQKPIKGSPYPRNYYRCSSSKGCTARKQVEKSHADPDMFVVCYTGDHNHTRPTVNRNPGSRYRYLGRTNYNIPLYKAYETSPPKTEMGSTSYVSPLLSATSLYSGTTPPSTLKGYIDNGVVAGR